MLTQEAIDHARRSDLLALAGVTLRKTAATGGGEYAGPCPMCGGRDRFRVHPKGPDGGRWYCRQCGGGKWHDAIDLVQRLKQVDFAEAVTLLTGGLPELASAPRHAAPEAVTESIAAPGETWQAGARAFCDEARQRLWSEAGASALAGLRARGLTDETIQAAGLGYNDHDRRDARAAWGLPDELTDKGKPKAVWLPRGVVIPWQIGGDLWRVNIRRPAEDLARDRERGLDPAKYIGPAGSSNGLYNADALRAGFPAVLVEGEIDALTIAQHGAGLAVAVATGSTHGARRTRWLARLAVASSVLVCYDADSAGDGAAAYWLGALPGARRWRPYWQDANAMAQDGADLRHWLALGLGLERDEVQPSAVSAGQSEGQARRQSGLGSNTSSALASQEKQAGLFAKPDPRAGRLVHGDLERARHKLADLEAELDAGASHLVGLPQPWPGDLVDELNAKAREADRLTAVADFATFDELEEATGQAYKAHCGNPSDPALLDLYRRLDDAWSAVLGLPESQAPAALVSPDQLARTQDKVQL